MSTNPAVETLLVRVAQMDDAQWALAGHRYALLMSDDNTTGQVLQVAQLHPRVMEQLKSLRVRAAMWREDERPGLPQASDEYCALLMAVTAIGLAPHLDSALVRQMSTPMLSVLGSTPEDFEPSRPRGLVALLAGATK